MENNAALIVFSLGTATGGHVFICNATRSFALYRDFQLQAATFMSAYRGAAR